ncbi:MAG TPA: peptidoglycan endopeptidase [Geobacteraceae bacterium]
MRRFVAVFFLLLFLSASAGHGASHPPYAVASIPTPLFSSPDFPLLFGGGDGGTLRLDSCGQMRSLEFVALPGTVFSVEEVVARSPVPVYRVTTADYPYATKTGYFIDGRGVEFLSTRPPERARRLPDKGTIIAALLAARGSRYVWGGNVHHGIPELLTLYPIPPGSSAGEEMRARWQLRGVDCSGLLYDATGGFTPRNTSALVTYGRGVPVAGLSAAAIASRLEPLDLIAWNGHVLIVIDRERVIESRLTCGSPVGVVVTPLRKRLAQIMKSRTPADAYREGEGPVFVVRRWYGEGRADGGN